MNKKTDCETNFAKIVKVTDLIRYLDDSNARLENRKYLYHYTNIDCMIKIFESKKWFLSNAQNMNDYMEFNNGDKEKWKTIFFASFVTDVKENIGMWSMYAQPWDDGVVIRLPKDIIKQWIKSIDSLHEVSSKTNSITGRVIEVDDKNRIFLSSVAYSNCDSVETEEVLTWSNVTNRNIKNATHIQELTGYVKDAAWSYEKEIRLKANVDGVHGLKKVAIEIPEFVFDAMMLTAGPLFRGDLRERLSERIIRTIETSNSLFFNKLKISNACSTCAYKQNILKK